MPMIIEIEDPKLAGSIEWTLTENTVKALARLPTESQKATEDVLRKLLSVFAGNLTLCLIQGNPVRTMNLLNVVLENVVQNAGELRRKLSA